MYLLDSDILIGLLRNDQKAIQKISELEKEQTRMFISSVSIHELIEGAFLSLKPKENLKAIFDLISRIFVLDFNMDCAKISGKISADLIKKGEKIGEIDILSASIAIQNNLYLVSRNVKHFGKIGELKLSLW